MSNPNYIVNNLAKLMQAYQNGKAQLLTNNAVYAVAGQFSNEQQLTNHNVEPITGLSDTESFQHSEVTTGYIALALYNNSSKTEMFSMILNSTLGVNDALIVVQYNDASPNLDQLLFVKSQEMVLLEEVKINLKPNDCLLIGFGKMQEDGKPLKVNITTIGKNFIRSVPTVEQPTANQNSYAVQSVSSARKGVFIALMIILAIAIGVLIYNIANPPKVGFRRRR